MLLSFYVDLTRERHKMTQFTHVARAVDPRYPTNLAIIIWSAVVGALMFGFRLVSGVDVLQAGISSVLVGLTLFIVWAFAREIDHQEQLSAFVSVALMTIALFVVDVQYNLLMMFYLISISRIVNRSVGLPVKLTDSIYLLLFTGLVGLMGSWVYAMMGATAFLLDSILPKRDRKQLVFAGLSTLIMMIAFVMQSSSLNPTLPTTEFIISISIVTLIFIPVIFNAKHLTVTADITKERLAPIRVQATQVIAVLFGYHVALWQGNQGILEFLPLWLTLAGVALFPLVKPIMPKWDLSRRKFDKLKTNESV